MRGCGSLLGELDSAIGVALLCTVSETLVDESQADICIHFGRTYPLAALFFELLLMVSQRLSSFDLDHVVHQHLFIGCKIDVILFHESADYMEPLLLRLDVA